MFEHLEILSNRGFDILTARFNINGFKLGNYIYIYISLDEISVDFACVSKGNLISRNPDIYKLERVIVRERRRHLIKIRS